MLTVPVAHAQTPDASPKPLRITTYQAPSDFHAYLLGIESDLQFASEPAWTPLEEADAIIFLMETVSSGHPLTGFGQAAF